MRYSAERRIPFPPAVVWSVLADLRHFAADDPFHHDFAWTGARRQGIGVMFSLRHTYAPIFPFRSDEVTCIVTEWRPGQAQSVLETNRRRYRSHTQRFSLVPLGSGDTLLRHDVIYRGIPWWLPLWRLWVSFWVLRRMRRKIDDVGKRCAALRAASVIAGRCE